MNLTTSADPLTAKTSLAAFFRATSQEILERDGLNELEKPPKPTLLLLFLMQCLRCKSQQVSVHLMGADFSHSFNAENMD